ncbi:putative RNA-binding protein EIF1AD [Augochlora pura]
MSKATKRKHVVKEIAEFSIPTESQSVVRILESRGNNLHEVEDSTGDQYLVSMPTKFRRNIWVKKGDFVLIEPISEGDKVKAEIVKILTREHRRWYQSQNCWPKEFNESSKSDQTNKNKENSDSEEDDLFVNTNRLPPKKIEDVSESSPDDSDSQ